MLLTAAALLGGCAGGAKVDYGRGYPTDKAQSEVVDVQVIRRGTTLEMTNASSRDFGSSTMWVNKQFARPIDGLAIGQTITVDLRDFRNEFGERFRAGGFFATERSSALSLVQLETDDAMIGLIAVRGEPDR